MSPNDSQAPQAPRKPRQDTAAWKAIVLKYQQPSAWRASWQLVNTIGPYLFLWYLMYHSLSYSYLLTFLLAVIAGLFLVRIFIIFHDCGHGSFLKSKLANDVVGFITGLLTLTPYYQWRWEHSIHHASAGALDRRGTGDVWTMTVEEYLKASRWKRFAYRLARNPWHCPALPVRDLAAFRLARCQPARAPISTLDEPGSAWNGCRAQPGVRNHRLPADSPNH
jgi:fatty acid desaturase